jgi:cell division initiation protein
MKISPLEIRQKTFEKNFRGYDKEEVDAFLLSLSQEWERVMDDARELKIRLQTAEKEVQKLREVESTLYKTLKTAEDTGANVVEQANKAAELLIKESQMNAESMMNDARTKSKNMVEEADEKAKNTLFNAQNKLNEIVMELKTLENHKQNVAHDLKQIANDVLDKASRIAGPTLLPDYSKMLTREEVKPETLKTIVEPISAPKPIIELSKVVEAITEISKSKLETKEPEIEDETTHIDPPKTSKSESFFDQIS